MFRPTSSRLRSNRKTDTRLFLESWLAKPLQVAALAPSSIHLAAAITREVPTGPGRVLELGPGTGVFTRALLARGVPESQLVLIEKDPAFARLLRERFPQALLLEADARHFSLPDAAGISAAVSGLPLLSMPHAHIRDILDAVFRQMAPDGALFQFTYGPLCPVPASVLQALSLQADFRRLVLRNVPPASVYRIQAKRNPAG